MKVALLPQRLPPALQSWGRLTPLLVMALVLLLSVLLAAVVAQFTHEQQRVRFEREATAHTTALTSRVSDFDKLLQATRAFWMANPTDVTPENFAQFSRELKLTQRYPDVLALGYNAWLPTGQESTLETLVSSFGLHHFDVHPQRTDQSMRAPIVLIAPQDAVNRSAQGYDMYVEATRRDAFNRARTRGAYQVSRPVELVQRDQQGRPYQGFLVILPVWRGGEGEVNARPDMLTGYLYLAVRADRFLSSLQSAYRLQGISSGVQLGGQPLTSLGGGRTEFRQSDTLELAGLSWTVQYAAPASFGRDVFGIVPYLILLAGILLAGLAYRLMQAQVQARERAELANHNLSVLQVRQERARAEFEAIFQSMQDAAAFTDQQGDILMVNRAMNRQFRSPRGTLEGQPLASLHVDRRLDSTQTFQSLTTPYRRRDQSLFQGEAQRTEVRDQKGEVFGLLEVVRDVSERVQAEQALQAEERRSRAVLDAIPHILWVSDPDGKVTYMNASHRKRLGAATVRERVHPQDLPAYDQMWEDAYAMRTRSQAELRLQVGPLAPGTSQARERWFELRVAPLLDDSGQAREWVASATDIHDRLVAERLSQRNEARYRGVLEGMPQIVWLAGTDGDITYFNRRWEEYVGPGHAAFLPTIHPDDRREYLALWQQSVLHHQPFEAEHRLLGADGLYRTFVTRGLPVRDTQGHVIEWVGTSTDVDDSVYAEMTARLLADLSTELTARVNDPLAKRTAKYQAALDLITDRIAVAGAIWTPPEAQLLARSHADTNWTLPHLQAATLSLVRQVMREEETQDITTHPLLHVVAASGAVVTPLVGLDGTLLGVLGLAYRHELHDRDHELVMEIAKRLAESLDNDALRAQALVAEGELVKLNQSLEERVQRRTLALEEANKELEAFSYSVSHDLRTPLRHVVGFGDLLRKESTDTLGPKGIRYLNVITDAAGRMNTLIDSLLEFSRMGRAQMKTAPVDLNALIYKAWQNLEPDRQGRQITFDLGDMPSTIDGDANLLDLVFQNLLSNAIKYTRTRPLAHISVTGESDGREVTIHVRDNGVGFDPKYADKLFGVFQRLHRSEEFDGTGIGLANVRRIVTRHGGTVHAQSVLDEGAVFSVTLPIHTPENP